MAAAGETALGGAGKAADGVAGQAERGGRRASLRRNLRGRCALPADRALGLGHRVVIGEEAPAGQADQGWAACRTP